MTATAKKKLGNIPRKKIADAVELALPKGGTFHLHVEKSRLGGMRVIRIVTPAWKTLRPAERISKVRAAVENALSENEQKRILRFSVLTPQEYRTLFKVSHHGRTVKHETTANRAVRKTALRTARAAAAK
jgi:hypothetical protein